MDDEILIEAQRALLFSLMGRLSSGGVVPNFLRPSATVMEKYVDGSLTLSTYPSHVPAIDPDDGSFLLEPGRTNYLTHNYAIDHPEWIKGSSVNVQKDLVYLPNGVAKGERVSFALGTGATNILKRTVTLPPGRDYVLTHIVALKGGQMTSEDVLRVTGEVVADGIANYAVLNDYPDNYRVIQVPFRTTGSSFDLLGDLEVAEDYAVLEVTESTITLEDLSTDSGTLNGIHLRFDGIDGDYAVTSSQRSGSNQILTVDPPTLVTDGVAAGDTAFLTDPQSVEVSVEMYVTSASSLDWGGMQVEEGTFRTSHIYQDREMYPRSDTLLDYRPEDNPLIGLRSFSFFIDLKEWRGDGNLATFGNVKAEVVGGKLKVTAGNVTLADTADLPDPAWIFVQVAAETSSMSAYVNGKLVNRTAVSNFAVSEGDFTLTSEGMRLFYSVALFNRIFGDGQVATGEDIAGDLATILRNRCRDFIYVSAGLANKRLPPAIVPGAEQPIAVGDITGVNTGAMSVMISDGDGFDISAGEIAAIVERKVGVDIQEIGHVTITGKSYTASPPEAILTLDTVSGIKVGDRISPTYVKRPGKASVRLPFSAKDTQTVQAVDLGTRKLTLGSTTSFAVDDTVVVQTAAYQDLGEHVVEAKDDVARTITLKDDIQGIDVGDLVSAIRSQTEIPPALYQVSFLRDVSKVRVAQKGTNGFVLENEAATPRLVEMSLTIPI